MSHLFWLPKVRWHVVHRIVPSPRRGGQSTVALATGSAGDVHLCHLFLVHAAQAHRGRSPWFMAPPPLEPTNGASTRSLRWGVFTGGASNPPWAGQPLARTSLQGAGEFLTLPCSDGPGPGTTPETFIGVRNIACECISDTPAGRCSPGVFQFWSRSITMTCGHLRPPAHCSWDAFRSGRRGRRGLGGRHQ